MKENGKITKLQTYLTVLYVSALLVSNILASKIMRLPFGITMTCSNLVFPITYILSDLFSEVYGYKWSRITCYLSFAMNLIMVLFIQLAIILPYPSYYESQTHFATVFGTSFLISFASFLAFIVGDFVNDKIFERMKHKDKSSFWVRAILSSIIGNIVDSVIFCSIAYIAEMTITNLLILICCEFSTKTIYEICFLPLTNLICKKVKIKEQGD